MSIGPRRRITTMVAIVATMALWASACANTHERPPIEFPPNASPSRIVDRHGRLITTIADENRRSISIDDVPVTMQQAIVAIEDAAFWEHDGVDVRAIARAADANAEAGAVSQGGSTITQQYVKNALLDDERTISRKVEEAALAMALERAYSKEVILEQYLNTIYFGGGAYGIEAAAQEFFGIPASQLSLAQGAVLAGVIQSPSRWDPRRNPEDATRRRNLVLARMEEEGYITPEQQLAASAEPVQTVPDDADRSTTRYPAPHFVEEVKRWLLTESDALGDSQAERYNNLLRGGLTITTTIDLDRQAEAEAAITGILPGQGVDPRMPDAALTSIEPSTGHIIAMVGGRDFWGGHGYAKLNLAEGAGRSTGSAFKPIVMATALGNGVPVDKTFSAPSSATFRTDSGPWRVRGGGIGAGTMAQCTVVSSNTCYANIVLDEAVGPEDSVATARRMGITSTELDAVPAAVLGANNATVRDMASVYATFANGGIHVPPVYVTEVEHSDGTVLYEHRHQQSKAIEPEVARQVNDILPGVIFAPNGTGTRAAIDRPAGGKTGSSQRNTDAWFCGHTAQLATAVWVGFSELRPNGGGTPELVQMVPGTTPITVYGGTYPAQIWAQYMEMAHAGQPPLPLNPPEPPPTTTTTSPGRPAILDPVPRESGDLAGVPDVTGMTGGNAESALERAGFRVESVEVDLGSSVTPGRAVAQSPPGGTSARPGSTVWIEVTEGSPASRTPIPDLRGFGRGQARTQLQSLGFTVSDTVEAPPPGTLGPTGIAYVGGQVWKTTPGAGQLSPEGSVVLHVTPLATTTTASTTTTTAPGTESSTTAPQD